MKTTILYCLVITFIMFLSCKKEKENLPACSSATVNYDGKTYNTVSIGTQCWMKENLNTGVRINANVDPTNNYIIEKYCYDDLESLCDTYGGLYQWDEIMSYSTEEGIRGICPDGWHIPSDSEWMKLVAFLGGDTVAGGKMKESGITHWTSPNTGANNSSGFSALPAGFRSPSGSGTFQRIGEFELLWSSTEGGSATAWYFIMSAWDQQTIRNNYIKKQCFIRSLPERLTLYDLYGFMVMVLPVW